MNVAPEIDAPARHLYLLKEKEGKYEAGEQRSTPTGESPGGFTQVDNAAILDTNLSLPARMLYAILRQHRNGGSRKCCPAYSRLCDLLGTTGKPAARTTVARSLKELLDAGLVAWERHGGVNDYCFKGDDGFEHVRAGIYDSVKRGPIDKNSGNYGWQVMVERRDGGKCIICGFSPAARHHIVPRREKGANLPVNIATLCPNHHALADRGEITRDALLAAIAERSSVGLLLDSSSPTLQPELSDATPEVAHGYSNNMKLTRRIEQENSAPTERAAPGPERPAKTVGTPEQPTPTVEARPTERERVPRAKRASADAKPAAEVPATPLEPTPIQRVEQGIKAAGVKVAMQWGRDGKALAELLAGSDVTTDDVTGCYVAIARGEYGSEYERRNLGVAFVCTKAMAGWLNWKEQGERGTNRQGAGQGGAGGAPRARAGDHRQPANPQHAAHAAKLDW